MNLVIRKNKKKVLKLQTTETIETTKFINRKIELKSNIDQLYNVSSFETSTSIKDVRYLFLSTLNREFWV